MGPESADERECINNSATEQNGTLKKHVLALAFAAVQMFLAFTVNPSHAAATGTDQEPPVKTQKSESAKKELTRRQRAALKVQKVLRGTASWYGSRFHGKKTASGDRYDPNKLTAAAKNLPLGSKAIVTNLKNGNSVEVEINDRGPYVAERVIDVSYAAAKELGFAESGTAPVKVEVVETS
jgi:peptidoglycan lytic transglycosylase